MPVPEMEQRLVYFDAPGLLPEFERGDAARHPLYLSTLDKMVSISHHLAHAYSAFVVSPFEEGVVMIADGVGSYQSDVMESYPASDMATPLARESESYYKFKGSSLECLKKVWMEPDRGFLSDEFNNMPGLGALHSRASTYIFAGWNKCGELMGLAPYAAGIKFRRAARRKAPRCCTGRIWPAHAGRHRICAAGPRPLVARNHWRQKPLHGRRRRAQLRGQRRGGPRSGL
jgi:hypothetical protein